MLRQALAAHAPEDQRTYAIRLALRVMAPYCPVDRLIRYWAAGDIPGAFPRLTETTEAFHAIVKALRQAGAYE